MKPITESRILWVDCLGGLIAGGIILSIAALISRLDSLPLEIVYFVGFANLAYGSYSLWLATRSAREIVFIKLLALANMAWLFFCIAIVATYWNEISVFGVFHKLAEGLYVASLGVLEWRWRNTLAKQK